ncbi:Basement membrane-specific heparan sulfate proteoglycan core protein, partial [Ophiophagus hannah]
MDVAVPHATGLSPAPEVEDCTCPSGYRGPTATLGTHAAPVASIWAPVSHAVATGTPPSAMWRRESARAASTTRKGSTVNVASLDSMGMPSTGRPETASHAPATDHPQPSSRETRTCFVDADGEPTCDSCAPGYIGRQCER